MGGDGGGWDFGGLFPDKRPGRDEGLPHAAEGTVRNVLRRAREEHGEHGPESLPRPLPGDEAWPHRRLRLGPLPVDALTCAEAVEAVSGLVQSGRGGAALLCTADALPEARRSPSFREALGRAELCLADGQRLSWAADLLGTPLPEDIPAAALLPPLLEVAARQRWRVFLVGTDDAQALEAAAADLERRSGARVVGTHRAVSPNEGVEATARAVLRAHPQLVLLALPSPAQERLAHALKVRVSPGVVVGLGERLGTVVRARAGAPRWLQRLGLGWAWRLLGGPRRLGRRGLLRDLRFLWAFARVLLERPARS